MFVNSLCPNNKLTVISVRSQGVFWSYSPSVNKVCAMRYYLMWCMNFNETWHKYSSHKWEEWKSFSRSEMIGQGH